MSKVKVLYQSSIPHVKMGGQKSLLALIDNLDRTKFEPEVIVPEEGDLSGELDKRSIKYHILRIPAFKPAKLPNLLKTYFKLKAIIRNGQYKIIHSDHDKFMLFVSFISGKFKTIYHARVIYSEKYDKYLNNRIDAIVTISEGVKSRFKDKQNLFKIYNGVDCTRFSPFENKDILQKELGLSSIRFSVLYLGQMIRSKGIYNILNIAKILEDEEIEFILLGEFHSIHEQNKWLDVKKQMNLKNVNWKGQKNNSYKWIQAVDVVLFPSHSEGMGRVTFESMATGTPVIGTDIPGINEAITSETGILVNINDDKGFATAIQNLKNDNDKLSSFSKNGIKRAVEVFDIKVHASNVMNLYEKLINE